MPLDTRIVVRLQQPDNSALVFPLWCDEKRSSQDDFASFATIRSVSVRHFVIRYSETIARTPVQNVRVEDANGRIWNADSVEKSDDRKRFMSIRGLSENTAETVTETPVDPEGMDALALGATMQSGIRRFAFTQNMVPVADFYSGGFPRRLRATFTGGGGIITSTNGPRSIWSADTNLDTAEIDDSGEPVSGDSTGRLFDVPETRPSETMLYFGVYFIDRGGEPDEIASIAFA